MRQLIHFLFCSKMMDITSNLRFRIRTENNSFEAMVDTIRKSDEDDIGALYYVVAVVLIYGLSIVMMIASHIRKNKQDSQLRNYLKEMSILRKNDRREKLYTKIGTTPNPVKNVALNLVQGEGKCTEECATATTQSQKKCESRETLCKNGNSDDNDSVFNHSCDEASERDEKKETSSLRKDKDGVGPTTPKRTRTQRQDSRSKFHFEVINEHAPL